MGVNASRRTRRSDALANHERLLAAAAVAIKQRGERVPMAELAALAGVGVGTLYRHFPTREHLFEALIRRSFQTVLARVQVAGAMPGDATYAIAWFLHETIAHRDQLILPLHGAPPILDTTSTQLQHQIRAELSALLARGREDGSVRDGVTAEDLVTAGAMLAQPLPTVEDWDARADRLAQIFLAGLRPSHSIRKSDS